MIRESGPPPSGVLSFFSGAPMAAMRDWPAPLPPPPRPPPRSWPCPRRPPCRPLLLVQYSADGQSATWCSVDLQAKQGPGFPFEEVPEDPEEFEEAEVLPEAEVAPPPLPPMAIMPSSEDGSRRASLLRLAENLTMLAVWFWAISSAPA